MCTWVLRSATFATVDANTTAYDDYISMDDGVLISMVPSIGRNMEDLADACTGAEVWDGVDGHHILRQLLSEVLALLRGVRSPVDDINSTLC